MNKNSKQRLKLLRAATVANQSSVSKGVRVISANPKRNTQQAVYTNSDEHGAVSITRHEPIENDRPMRGNGKVARSSSRPQRRS